MIGLAIMAAATALPSDAAIPEPYQGEWTSDRTVACGDEDTNGVRIDPRNIAFYEAGGPVRSVAKRANDVSARVDFTGEGRNWTETVRLRLVPGNRLRMTALGQTMVLDRCRPALR